MDFKIFINDQPFTADEQTIDSVIDAIEAKGFVLDKTTGSWQSPVLKVGDTVKLTHYARGSHRCPEGREDNTTAVIRSIGPNGEVNMSRDLEGCKWWNVTDLTIATAQEDAS